VAWTSWSHDSCVLNAAVLRWTEPALSTDGSAIHSSSLTETAACHISTAAVLTGCGHAGDGDA